MLHGIYVFNGPQEHLQGRSALLRQDPKNDDNYLAQFDALHLVESYDWHVFPKKRFVNITGEK